MLLHNGMAPIKTRIHLKSDRNSLFQLTPHCIARHCYLSFYCTSLLSLTVLHATVTPHCIARHCYPSLYCTPLLPLNVLHTTVNVNYCHPNATVITGLYSSAWRNRLFRLHTRSDRDWDPPSLLYTAHLDSL